MANAVTESTGLKFTGMLAYLIWVSSTSRT